MRKMEKKYIGIQKEECKSYEFIHLYIYLSIHISISIYVSICIYVIIYKPVASTFHFEIFTTAHVFISNTFSPIPKTIFYIFITNIFITNTRTRRRCGCCSAFVVCPLATI
jgi:hypothetical protein